MKYSPFLLVLSLGLGSVAVGCKGDATGGPAGTGGSATGGATGTGGNATGGSTGTGGNATGGSTGTGGNATGGSIGTGGSATGGTGAGGSAGLTGAGGTGGSSVGGHGGGAIGGAAGGGGAAAGTGGAAGGTTSGCAYKLCENFESGAVGALPTGWTAYNGYGGDAMKGVALASDQAHSGAMSLKSSSMVPGEERIQKSLAALGTTASKHWGRIFYKVQSPGAEDLRRRLLSHHDGRARGDDGEPGGRLRPEPRRRPPVDLQRAGRLVLHRLRLRAGPSTPAGTAPSGTSTSR